MGKEETVWPTAVELERWLMNTVKDADEEAVFLRRMLQMNPAYGAYLVSDCELARIVQLFAKRFRTKIASSESPIHIGTLYEPLCEICWRVVGHVLHSLLDLEDIQSQPVPREAVGQVKFLLQTNMELSKKFNDMRRAYLRELSEHRDRQREISAQAKGVIQSLHEDPIMFFEPLEFVLDDSTKEFVREVVEERVKLGIQRGELRRRKKQEGEVDELDELDVEELKIALHEALREKKRLMKEGAKAKQDNREKEESVKMAMAQMEKDKALAAQAEKDLEEARTEVDELKLLIENMQKEHANTERQVLMMDRKKSRNEVISQEVEELRRHLADMQDQMGMKNRELERTKKHLRQLQNNETDSVAEMRTQLEKALEVEKDMREANRKLEKALDTERARRKKEPGGAPTVVSATDADIKKAVEDVTEKFDKQVKEKDSEISRLKEELQAALDNSEAGMAETAKKRDRKLKEQLEEMNRKYEQLEEQHTELQDEYEKLQEQVKRLIAKLEELGAKDFVKEMKEEIDLEPPKGRKRKRKERAFERLYNDAQRRILDMRMKAEGMQRSEEMTLMDAVRMVKDRSALKQAEVLRHLQQASNSTRSRFHDAVAKFQERHLGKPAEAKAVGLFAAATTAVHKVNSLDLAESQSPDDSRPGTRDGAGGRKREGGLLGALSNARKRLQQKALGGSDVESSENEGSGATAELVHQLKVANREKDAEIARLQSMIDAMRSHAESPAGGSRLAERQMQRLAKRAAALSMLSPSHGSHQEEVPLSPAGSHQFTSPLFGGGGHAGGTGQQLPSPSSAAGGRMQLSSSSPPRLGAALRAGALFSLGLSASALHHAATHSGSAGGTNSRGEAGAGGVATRSQSTPAEERDGQRVPSPPGHGSDSPRQKALQNAANLMRQKTMGGFARSPLQSPPRFNRDIMKSRTQHFSDPPVEERRLSTSAGERRQSTSAGEAGPKQRQSLVGGLSALLSGAGAQKSPSRASVVRAGSPGGGPPRSPPPRTPPQHATRSQQQAAVETPAQAPAQAQAAAAPAPAPAAGGEQAAQVRGALPGAAAGARQPLPSGGSSPSSSPPKSASQEGALQGGGKQVLPGGNMDLGEFIRREVSRVVEDDPDAQNLESLQDKLKDDEASDVEKEVHEILDGHRPATGSRRPSLVPNLRPRSITPGKADALDDLASMPHQVGIAPDGAVAMEGTRPESPPGLSASRTSVFAAPDVPDIPTEANEEGGPGTPPDTAPDTADLTAPSGTTPTLTFEASPSAKATPGVARTAGGATQHGEVAAPQSGFAAPAGAPRRVSAVTISPDSAGIVGTVHTVVTAGPRAGHAARPQPRGRQMNEEAEVARQAHSNQVMASMFPASAASAGQGQGRDPAPGASRAAEAKGQDAKGLPHPKKVAGPADPPVGRPAEPLGPDGTPSKAPPRKEAAVELPVSAGAAARPESWPSSWKKVGGPADAAGGADGGAPSKAAPQRDDVPSRPDDEGQKVPWRGPADPPPAPWETAGPPAKESSVQLPDTPPVLSAASLPWRRPERRESQAAGGSAAAAGHEGQDGLAASMGQSRQLLEGGGAFNGMASLSESSIGLALADSATFRSLPEAPPWTRSMAGTAVEFSKVTPPVVDLEPPRTSPATRPHTPSGRVWTPSETGFRRRRPESQERGYTPKAVTNEVLPWNQPEYRTSSPDKHNDTLMSRSTLEFSRSSPALPAGPAPSSKEERRNGGGAGRDRSPPGRPVPGPQQRQLKRPSKKADPRASTFNGPLIKESPLAPTVIASQHRMA